MVWDILRCLLKSRTAQVWLVAAWRAEDLGLISHFTLGSVSSASLVCCDDAKILPSLWAGWLRVQTEIIYVILGQMVSALRKLKCKFLPSFFPPFGFGNMERGNLNCWKFKLEKPYLVPPFKHCLGKGKDLKLIKKWPSSFLFPSAHNCPPTPLTQIVQWSQENQTEYLIFYWFSRTITLCESQTNTQYNKGSKSYFISLLWVIILGISRQSDE